MIYHILYGQFEQPSFKFVDKDRPGPGYDRSKKDRVTPHLTCNEPQLVIYIIEPASLRETGHPRRIVSQLPALNFKIICTCQNVKINSLLFFSIIIINFKIHKHILILFNGFVP